MAVPTRLSHSRFPDVIRGFHIPRHGWDSKFQSLMDYAAALSFIKSLKSM